MAFDIAQIGERVRRERQKAGLSLAQLAEATGLTKAYLVRLENQAGNPSLEVLAQIADALDVTIADLVNAPVMTYSGDGGEAPPSLKAFAEEAKLSSTEFRMLASIKWRRGEQPETKECWRFVFDSLRASRRFDDEGRAD